VATPWSRSPARRVIAEEERGDGRALPWHDMKAFLHRVIAIAAEDLKRARGAGDGWVFFDRGLIDALVALGSIEGESAAGLFADGTLHYHHRVFLVPPWPEIFVQDDARRHDLLFATQEYSRLLAAYPALGYETIVLPKVSVAQRADHVLECLGVVRG
jgi:predicted ATPase